MEIKLLKKMPPDKVFNINSNDELCHATGYKLIKDGETWNEYVDSLGEFHYEHQRR